MTTGFFGQTVKILSRHGSDMARKNQPNTGTVEGALEALAEIFERHTSA